jgi:uncharacterized repeat protein (TIGR01451 family)
VSESAHAGSGTSLSDYDSDVSCDSSKGSTDPGTSHTLSVSYGDQVICTITNHRKAEVRVIKQLDPATDPGKFDLTIGADTYDNSGDGYGDGGSTGFHQVANGSVTVSESAHTGSSLSDYVSDVDCGSKGTSSTTSKTFTVGYGDQVTCTITNHRKPEVQVIKQLDPASDSGLFDLSIAGTSYDNSGAGFGDGGSTGFQQVSPGSVTVGEAGHGSTSLSDYDSDVDCGAKGTSATTSKTITVAYGDSVTCTITNHRKPEIKVDKVLAPSTDTGRFDLKIDGTTASGPDGVGDGGTTGFQQVSAGEHSVSEAAHSSATDLGDYSSKVSCDSDKGSTDPGTSHSLTVGYGDRVTCTITNTLIPINVGIDKKGPDFAHDGDKLTYTITVSNPGTTTLRNVTVTDAIKGQTHGCDAGGGPTLTGGDANGDGLLQTTETWTYSCTYTVQHSDEDSAHNIVNVASVTASDNSGHSVGPVTDDATTKILHPAIAIDKTGPATGQAGDLIGYVLTVTNPGDTGFAESTVKLQDAQCTTAVQLLGKGGDTSPDSLDPGDVWSYSCGVQTNVGDTAVHNTGSVTGCDQLGGCVSAEDSADTTLTQPEQLLLPERITPGSAKLAGRTGCVAKAFNARVRGTKIATVVFFLDGKKVKTLRKPNAKKDFQLRVNPAKMKIGVHRLVANVTFASGSGTKPKTIRLSFQRCAKKLAKPRFTG